MFNKFIAWFAKNPNKKFVLRSGSVISATIAKTRTTTFLNVINQQRSLRALLKFQKLDESVQKAFMKDVINGTSTSKLLARFDQLTMSNMERGFKRNPEIKAWFDKLPLDQRQYLTKQVDQGYMPFSAIQHDFRIRTKLDFYKSSDLSLVFNPHYTGINSAQRDVAMKNIASNYGLSIKQYFGGGNQGIAAELSNGQVLKITNNPDEVAGALLARSRTTGNKHLVISNIRPLRVNGQTTDYYVMTMDKVTTLTDIEKQYWQRNYGNFLNPRKSTADFYADLVKQYDEMYASKSASSSALKPSTIWGKLTTGGSKEEALAFWKKLKPQRDAIIKDFKKMKIYSNEAHTGNVGFDQYGRFKHFDFWIPTSGATRDQIQKRAYKWKPVSIDMKILK
jgi:hypothetical protein